MKRLLYLLSFNWITIEEWRFHARFLVILAIVVIIFILLNGEYTIKSVRKYSVKYTQEKSKYQKTDAPFEKCR